MEKGPPKLADKIFEWYCNDKLKESIQGDLHERFYDDLKKYHRSRARFYYWMAIIRFCNRHTLKRKSRSPNRNSIFLSLIKNYLKVSTRHLWKHKSSSSINVFGFAIALACCFIIFLFVRQELSLINFIPKWIAFIEFQIILFDLPGILSIH